MSLSHRDCFAVYSAVRKDWSRTFGSVSFFAKRLDVLYKFVNINIDSYSRISTVCESTCFKNEYSLRQLAEYLLAEVKTPLLEPQRLRKITDAMHFLAR